MAKEQAQQHTRQSCRVEWEINFSLLAFVSASFFSYIQFFGWFFFSSHSFHFSFLVALTRNARNVVCCYVVILMRKMAAEERRKTEKNGKCFQDIIKIKIKMPLQPPANCHKFMKISTFSIFNREAFWNVWKQFQVRLVLVRRWETFDFSYIHPTRTLSHTQKMFQAFSNLLFTEAKLKCRSSLCGVEKVTDV